MGQHALWTILIFSMMLLLILASCGKQTATKDYDAGDDDETAGQPANVKKGVKPEPDREVAVIETDYGKIVIELYPNIAPQMVARFKQLAAEGFYNGTTFHRISPQLIQGGDPLSKDDEPNNDGTGNSPYPNLPGEFSDITYTRGVVGAARRGASPAFGNQPALTETQAYDTANCQFFITLQTMPQFDRRYTVFGRVIEGLNNAVIIGGAPVVPNTERPADKIIIKSITLRTK
jgi:cyclophilin family peptidyl-prolyl cis-trans isomerase